MKITPPPRRTSRPPGRSTRRRRPWKTPSGSPPGWSGDRDLVLGPTGGHPAGQQVKTVRPPLVREPVLADDRVAHVRVRQATSTPMAFGESPHMRPGLTEFLRAGGVRYLRDSNRISYFARLSISCNTDSTPADFANSRRTGSVRSRKGFRSGVKSLTPYLLTNCSRASLSCCTSRSTS